MELRPYQQTDLQRLRDNIRDGCRSQLLVEPTGAGKGTQASFMIRSAVAKGNRVVFLVNRRSLVADMSQRMDKLGIDHGVIMGSHPRSCPSLPVQVVSIDTAMRRETLPPADLVFIDEAHFAVSDGWKKAIAQYKDAHLIGMTATPCRLDGAGLGEIFGRMVIGPSPADLIAQGYLVPVRVFGPRNGPDMAGIRRNISKDFAEKETEQVMGKAALVGDIISHWTRIAKDLPTVLFAVNRHHSEHMRDSFLAEGISSVSVDANTSLVDRNKIWDKLSSGEIKVVCSVGIISYGWDCPAVRCGIDASPTLSLAKFLQRVGRIVRPDRDKHHAILLDHAGNTSRHGFFEDHREWSLDGGLVKSKDKEAEEPTPRFCERCFCHYSKLLRACPQCGEEHIPPRTMPKVKQGELAELSNPTKWWKCHGCGKVWAASASSPCCGTVSETTVYASKLKTDWKEYYLRLLEEGRAKNYKDGWAMMRYKSVTGQFPNPAWKREFFQGRPIEGIERFN